MTNFIHVDCGSDVNYCLNNDLYKCEGCSDYIYDNNEMISYTNSMDANFVKDNKSC